MRQNDATPLYATPRNLANRSDGDAVALVAATLGTPLMPWQQLVADVATERNDDGSYVYPIVVISVPRQSGKTTLLRAIAVHQMMDNRRREIYYTAQTGKDARARWEQLVSVIESSKHAGQMFSVRKSAGSAAIEHRKTHSKFLPFAPGGDSLHGYTPHVVMIDEAFSLNEVEGRNLYGAFGPAQSTITTRQLYIVSTKGTAESVFLNDYLARGHAGEPGVALVEYAAPADADPYDPETWWTSHPSLGIKTPNGGLTEAYLRSEAKAMPRSEFERAYCNRQTLTVSNLIPHETWQPLASSVKASTSDAVAISYDVAHDLTAATIVVSWVDRAGKYDGILHHRIVEHHAGVEWLVQSVIDLNTQLSPALVAADDGGAARGVTAELERRGIVVSTTSATELATAFGRWMIRLKTSTVTHDGTTPFWTAVAGITTRPMGDTVAPSRRNSIGDISPAIAAMVAGLKLEQMNPPASKPRIYFPEDAA